MSVASWTDMPSPQEEVALSLTVGLSVPSQLVRGELEYLQQDVWWRDTEPSGPVHAASPLQSRAGLGQPVPTACPCQPTGLPLPELPAHLEFWALGRGTWAGLIWGWWQQGPSCATQSWVFTRPCRACGLSLPLLKPPAPTPSLPPARSEHSLLGAEAYSPYAVLSNLREGMEEEVRDL